MDLPNIQSVQIALLLERDPGSGPDRFHAQQPAHGQDAQPDRVRNTALPGQLRRGSGDAATLARDMQVVLGRLEHEIENSSAKPVEALQPEGLRPAIE